MISPLDTLLKRQLIPLTNGTFSRVLHGRDEIYQSETGAPPRYGVFLACFYKEKERNRIESVNWIGNTYTREFSRDWRRRIVIEAENFASISADIKIRDKRLRIYSWISTNSHELNFSICDWKFREKRLSICKVMILNFRIFDVSRLSRHAYLKDTNVSVIAVHLVRNAIYIFFTLKLINQILKI